MDKAIIQSIHNDFASFRNPPFGIKLLAYFYTYLERDYKQDALQAIRRYYSNTKRHVIFPRFRVPKG